MRAIHRVVRGAPLARAALCAALAAGCAPSAPVLRGTVVPAQLPGTQLPPVHRKIVFRWSYAEPDLRIRGDGAARVAPPDSVRLDFFVSNESTGWAELIDGELRLPSKAGVARKVLPPVPLLWAALGRLQVPPAADTAARVDGDTLRVDIGHDPRWRATFVRDQLVRLELIDGGRVPQWLARTSDGPIHYQHETARRTLDLFIVRVDTVPAFDASIWQ